MHRLSRRAILLGGAGLVGSAGLAATLTGCSTTDATHGSTHPIGPVPSASPSAGQGLVQKSLVARETTLDLGGPTVATWAYGDTVPGALIRAKAGDFLRISLENKLPADTSIHWHGLRLRNAADGVPGLTQDAVKQGDRFVYEFTAPDPGTYFFHPHVGVQLDRALYAPLVIEDPNEPGGHDDEWVVVLDDWVDGTGRTPDDVLKKLVDDGGGSHDMGGMGGGHDMGGHDMGGGGTAMAPWGDAGDVTYPHFLVNGRVPAAPERFTAKPGQKVRLRIINAASDTIFTVALGGHRMTLTHTDGHPVVPREVGAFHIGMGERYDAVVTLADGVFPLVAAPFGKTSGGQAMAVVRTGAGSPPAADVRPAELSGEVFIGSQLLPAESAKLPDRVPDATLQLSLDGSMKPYVWGMNGAPFGKNDPLTVQQGQRLRIDVTNQTMMTHPLHLHGHTFALPSGLRKDTVLLAPMQRLAIDLDADNVGRWAVHCHNIYHAEAGMMTELRYTES
ncbi:multicopper oxidase family protein [Aestuariimicrobium kwangyangense]|uniref:multicopper oxidase family protein n=1 Tax=Aestuariimicrobium kwangyangense TaxID=396389 RepID=UPI00041A36DC|nr:multicopper oxidase family protein [Aestuariimicrobium kwangyangense]